MATKRSAKTKDASGVEAAKQALKQHIAFYASTPTYHSVLAFHGWEEAGNELHRMSREGRWKEMPGVISDAMLEEWAIVGTADEFAALWERAWVRAPSARAMQRQ